MAERREGGEEGGREEGREGEWGRRKGGKGRESVYDCIVCRHGRK